MNPSLLRNPRVVAAVLLGLVAVIALNVKTFAPRRGFFRRAADPMANHLAPPADLDEVVRGAVDADGKPRQFAVAGASQGMGLSRDPFSGNEAHRAPTAAAAPATTPRRRRPVASSDAPLVCAAVMLNADHPVALINGQAYHLGDRVRGLEVVGIGTDGVTLRARDGHESSLTVGTSSKDSQRYHVVTETLPVRDRDDTRLATDSAERTGR